MRLPNDFNGYVFVKFYDFFSKQVRLNWFLIDNKNDSFMVYEGDELVWKGVYMPFDDKYAITQKWEKNLKKWLKYSDNEYADKIQILECFSKNNFRAMRDS